MPTLSTRKTQLKRGGPGYIWGAQTGDAVLALDLLPPSACAPAQCSRQELGSGLDGCRLLLYACVLLTNQSLLKFQQAPIFFLSRRYAKSFPRHRTQIQALGNIMI